MDNRKVQLVGSFMEIEGKLKIIGTTTNYDRNGGVKFQAHKDDEENKYNNINIVLDKNQVEAINECESIKEIYECYKQMEFFNRGLF